MKVKFMPSGEEYEIESNETILHLAQKEGLHIQSVCKGLPSCAECRIQIKEGEHHVLPPSTKELALIGTAHYVDMSRLSCQLRCFGDVTVDLSEQIEKEKRVSQKPYDRMARSDGEKSKAVLGGILDNVIAADVEMSDEDAAKVGDIEKVEVEAFKGAPKLDRRDSFYGDFYTGKKKKKKSNQKRGNDRNKPKRNQKSAKSADSNQTDEDGKPKRKRSRNRNRKKTGQGAPAAKDNS